MNNLNFTHPLQHKSTEIPFNIDKDFTWQRFENLCKDLAKAEFEIEDVRPYGVQGDNQEGIDIYAYDMIHRKYLTVQCKKVKNYNAAKIKKAVDIFLEGEFKNKSFRFILCCTDDLNKGNRQIEIDKQTLRLANLEIEFLKWDFYGINALLKKHPKIVGDTFGKDWVKMFNGDEAFAKYMEHYRPMVPKPAKINYEPLEIYIKRTVTRIKDYNKESFFYNRERKSIVDLLETNSNEKVKYILLSQGGNGKSAEISYLANYYSETKTKFFPIRIDLRNLLEGEQIEKLLEKRCVTWQAIEDRNLLLLFDGLDEVGVKEYQEFIKRINTFSEEHENARVIISSRTNYFNSLNGNYLLDNFEVIFLDDLTTEQIDEFLRFKLKEKKSEFDILSDTNGFDHLLASPFYLVSLADIFLETYSTNDFPKSKANILSLIIEKQFEKAKLKFAFSEINLSQYKKRVNKLLKLIAFSMTQLGRNSISLDEFQTIIPNDQDRQILRYSLLDFVNDQYQFNHNLVQEYLTGLQLKDLEIKTIEQLVSFKPSFSKIKNKWLNSLSFLLSLLPKNDSKLVILTNWLIKIEPEVLIMMEPDKFTSDFRFVIVKKIIEIYKLKEIHIPYYYFQDKDLGKFAGNSKKLLEYCLFELNNIQNPFETKLVCIRIIRKFENFFGKENIVKQQLLVSITENIDYPYLQEQTIRCLANLHSHIDIDNTFEYLKNNCKNIDDKVVRNGIYELLEYLPFQESFLEFAIDGIKIIKDDKETTRVMNEEKPIEKILLRTNTAKSFIKIINVLIDDKELLKHSYSRMISFDKEFLKNLITIGTTLYSEDKSIFSYIIKLIEVLHYEYVHKGYYKIVNCFFDITKTSSLAFDHFYRKSKASNDSWMEIQKMLLFANKTKLKKVFSAYERKEIPMDYIFITRNLLQAIDINLHDWFYSFINERSANNFLYTESSSFDWQKHKENQKLTNQKILLNKVLFLKEVKKIFTTARKTELTNDELFDYRKAFIQNEDQMNNTLLIPLLRDWAERMGKINYSFIVTNYKNQKRWEFYVVSEIANILNANQTINEELKEFAISYVHKTISSVEMEKSITDTSDEGFTHTYFCGFINTFCKSFELNLSQTELLEILYTDFHSVYDYNETDYNNRPSNYVLSRITDRGQLKRRILENLKAGKIAIPVLGSQFYLCEQLKMTEAKSYLYNELSRDLFSEHAKVRLLDIYLKLGGEISDMLELFLGYAKRDYWYWHLGDKLIVDYKKLICAEYVKSLKSSVIKVEDKINISLKLLQQGSLEGIRFFCSFVIQFKRSPFDYHFWQNSTAKFPIKNSIKLLLVALKVPFKYPNIQIDSFSRIDESIYTLLNSIGLQSEEGFTEVCNGYKMFMIQNEKKLSKVKNLNYPLQSLENQYYKNKEETIQIEEVLIVNKSLNIIT